jgi:hypothetical protein
MIRKLKIVPLSSGECLTYWRSDGGTCTVEVQFAKDAPVAVASTTGSIDDALLSLAARFRTLAITLENLTTDLSG